MVFGPTADSFFSTKQDHRTTELGRLFETTMDTLDSKIFFSLWCFRSDFEECWNETTSVSQHGQQQRMKHRVNNDAQFKWADFTAVNFEFKPTTLTPQKQPSSTEVQNRRHQNFAQMFHILSPEGQWQLNSDKRRPQQDGCGFSAPFPYLSFPNSKHPIWRRR